jgi:hypothetical protein
MLFTVSKAPQLGKKFILLSFLIMREGKTNNQRLSQLKRQKNLVEQRNRRAERINGEVNLSKVN